ncbi:MAG: type I phosphomannose isomerase catalytic subunit [Planctomycetota bacterium]
MRQIPAYPLRFKEIFKQTIWGGGRLRAVFGKNIPPENKTGESWEISDHGDDVSVVADGPLADRWTLRKLCDEFPTEVLGTALADGYREKFPLLLKFIDANDDLSVQVHPPDEYARVHENGELGKTEAWYIIEAQPGSRLIRGLKPGTTREEFRSLLDAGTLEKCLHSFEVKGGDVIFLSAGTIHAIGKGIVLAEMQQNSDTTYRVYDWNRVGLDGRPRELNVEKALDVINFDAPPDEGVLRVDRSERRMITDCKYFTTEAITLAGNSVTESVSPERFEILCAVEGAGMIAWSGGEMDIAAGTSLLLPAAMGDYTVSSGKRLRILRTLPGQNPG